MKYIKLNTNESPFPPSERVTKAVREESEKLNLYPDPECRKFLEPLADYLGVKTDNVFASNGSDEVLAFIFQSMCEKGAAFADITYGFYSVYCDLYGVDKEIIPLKDDLSIDISDYFDKGKTIFIANPNAPTGLCLEIGDIEQVVRRNPDNLVVIDEAYVDFGGESAVSLIDKYDNLIVVGTFSKSRSLAGGRLGYAAANSSIISDLNRIKFSFNPYNLNRMTLAAGAAALEDDEYFKRCVSAVIKTREKTKGKLRSMRYSVTESKANFLFAKHPSIPGETLYKKLRDCGILVRRFDKERIDDYLRITVGTDEQMDTLMEQLIKIEREILN